MSQFVGQFLEMIGSLSIVRKISMAIVLIAAVSVVGYLVHVSNQASLEPLFTNLSPEDMGSIVTRLDKQNMKYQVDQEKRTVLVPSTEVLAVRLKLAEEGLPRFGGVGFELFDKGGFGMSDFEQRVNYQRALEGELTRTIGSIREIESARVHLVLPEKSLFADSQQSATASVIVKLGGGVSLDKSRVNAITHLVASAVESLTPEQVTILDTTGRLLTSSGGDASVVAGGQAFDQKVQIEHFYENRIAELLAPVVGVGKVLARVTADIDFTRTESTDEILDPNKSAVVSEARTTNKKVEGGTGAAAAAAASGSGSNTDEGSEQISYQVSKTVRRQITPMGAVKGLSVAVLVDGVYTEKDGKQIYAPRPAAELARLEEIVKRAVGFSDDRGDKIKMENMEFKSADNQVQASQAWYQKKTTYGFIMSVIGNVLVVAMILLVFFLVIRPLVKGWGARSLGFAEGGLPAQLEGGGMGDVKQLVQADPIAAANAIRQWLR